MDLVPPPLVRQVGEANQWSDFDDVTKIMALTFGPFYSKFVYGDDLNDLTSPYGNLTLLECHDLPIDGEPLNQIRVMVGNPTDVPLHNVKAFFEQNSLTTDRTWQYDFVMMVGFNRETDVPVDIPLSYMPSLINIYGSSEQDIGECPENAIIDNHQFRSMCKQCFKRKSKCNYPRDDQCKRCESSGDCEPNPTAEIISLNRLMADHIISNASFLCPAFQYLFSMIATVLGLKSHYSSSAKVQLRSIMNDEIIFGTHQESIDKIKTECSSWQIVSFKNGRLVVDESENLGNRIAWSTQKVRRGVVARSKIEIGKAFNPFGVANPDEMVSMFNSSIASPGEIIVRDFAMWDKHLLSIGTRFAMVTEILDIDHFRITVGWK